MAKFVIAGICNCPHYAKAELIADQLARNLPNFQIYKILKSPNDWEDWLHDICVQNSWKHTKSPIIWRECLDRGGEGMYIGDSNAFQEYAKGYYGIFSNLTSYDLKQISAENEETFNIMEAERLEQLRRIKPYIITISHASSPLTNHILPKILNSDALNSHKDLNVRLYERDPHINLDGIRMEVEDLAASRLRNVQICDNEQKAFENCDLAILLDELEIMDVEQGVESQMPKKTIITKYYNPYGALARSIDKYAKTTCRVLITPFESSQHIYGLVTVFYRNLNRINGRENLIGNSLYYEFIAKSILAKRLKICALNIKDIIVIGQNFKESHYIDIAQSKVTGYNGAIWARNGTHWISVVEMIADVDWLQKDYPLAVCSREEQIRKVLGRNAILAFGQSIVKLLDLWLNVNNTDRTLHSVVIHANGYYGVKNDLCLSLPVVFDSGKFNLKSYFKLNAEVNDIIAEIVNDTDKCLSEKFIGDIFNQITSVTPLDSPVPEVDGVKDDSVEAGAAIQENVIKSENIGESILYEENEDV